MAATNLPSHIHGQHGAKLTNFMYELDDEPTENIPLFVGELQGGQVNYTYFGQYRSHVKNWHAAELSKPDKPRWLHEAMKDHFWPLPNISQIALDQVVQVLKEHNKETEEWMDNLAEDVIMKCFEELDFGADNFTLRLSWEYFECTGYDVEFYSKLVQRKLVEEAVIHLREHDDRSE